MLVLSRKKSERVFVTLPDGDRVVVAVVKIRGDKVRLGFDAPADVIIARDDCKKGARDVLDAA